jgi:hypothetical protein
LYTRGSHYQLRGLRGRWCDTVRHVHAPTEDKIDDVEDSFYEELERVFDKLSKYHVNILLGKFNVKVDTEDHFKSTIGRKVYTKLLMIMELG